MEGENGVTRSIIDELYSKDNKGDQMEGESGVTRSVIDEVHFSISNEIMWKMPVLLLEVSSMNFILGISKAMKCKVTAWCYSKYHRRT